MNNLQIFNNPEFGQVRTIEKDGEPWFVGKDVAEILGYTKLDAMYRVISDEDKKNIDPQTVENTGFPQNGATLEPNPNVRRMVLINESGLYDAIFHSKLESAKRFRRWVTSEVLPSIRKNGAYIKNQENMTPEEIMAEGLLAAQRIIQSKDRQIEQQGDTIERMKPKELFADAVTASKTSILIGDLAKLLKQNGYSVGQNRLFEKLRNEGYLIKGKHRSDRNMPTQKSMELGLFEVKETTITHSDGHVSISKTVKVTGKGQVYFVNKFLGE